MADRGLEAPTAVAPDRRLPRWLAGGSSPFLLIAGICASLGLLGFAFFAAPVPVTAGVAGAVLTLLSFHFPHIVLGVFAFVQIAFPLYARLPAIGPVPPLPVGIAILAVLGMTSIVAWLMGDRSRASGPSEPVFMRLFLVFAAVGMFSLFNDRTTEEGINMWIKVFIIPGAMMLICLFRLSDSRDIDRIFRYMLAGAAAAAGYALLEFLLGYNPLLEMYDGQTDAVYHTADELGSGLAYRTFSVFTQPIEFATCLSMIFPYSVVRLATTTHLGHRILYAFGGGMCVLGVALTFSRGPVLALIVSAVTVGLIYRNLRPTLIALLATGILTIAVAWPFLGAGISDRLNDMDNVTLRFKLWQTAFAIFTDHPVRGVGIGNFPEYYIEAARTHLIGPFTEFGEDAVENVRVAESTYLQLLAEMGVLGLVSAVALILAFFRLVITTALRSTDPLGRDLSIAAGVGGVAYLVNGITITAYTHFTSTSLLVGLLFPFALVLNRRAPRTGGDLKSGTPAEAS
ncbi:O-antigen ligase family protein [Rhizobium sp. LjRoot254]|uniref:O-antigen ligase family protein n=1 Tax=Rhizobium sp. LjRoot254 TaxID=3342297 RepID=UPI003ECF93C8